MLHGCVAHVFASGAESTTPPSSTVPFESVVPLDAEAHAVSARANSAKRIGRI
jgi:hypothetical protein